MHGAGLSKRTDSVSIPNRLVAYATSVGVGSPPTAYTLIIDTGSSDTWIGAKTSYIPTCTSSDTGNNVSVSYLSGKFSGKEYIDTVTLSSSLVVAKQSIGVASNSTGIVGFDGILGVGPITLTKNTVTHTKSVPSVTDNLFTQGTISSDVLSIYFTPISQFSGGELTFGGVDTTKTTSSVVYVPITSKSPAKDFWGIDQSITYGTTSILSNAAGIVDTGSTFIHLATDAFNKYKNATGAIHDNHTGLLKISSEQYGALKPLNFHIGGSTFALSPNAQIWPRSFNKLINGATSDIYLIVTDLRCKSGSGLDFVNGYTFLERFYSVYDTTNSRIGFAQTAYTNATTN